ncbi:MAG: hypothetical protein KGO01_19490 [Burkholderiales bacterium]|nr:hypothetical protein [Burkholderiales bacterium]
MKHMHTPIRRLITEPRVCAEVDDSWPWEYDEFESFVACMSEEQPDEGDEYQRNEIAANTGPKIPGNY